MELQKVQILAALAVTVASDSHGRMLTLNTIVKFT